MGTMMIGDFPDVVRYWIGHEDQGYSRYIGEDDCIP